MWGVCLCAGLCVHVHMCIDICVGMCIEARGWYCLSPLISYNSIYWSKVPWALEVADVSSQGRQLAGDPLCHRMLGFVPSKPRFFFFFLIFMSGCFGLGVHVYTASMQYLWRPHEGTRCPKTGVTEACKLLCRCWESNLGPSEDSQCSSASFPVLAWISLCG